MSGVIRLSCPELSLDGSSGAVQHIAPDVAQTGNDEKCYSSRRGATHNDQPCRHRSTHYAKSGAMHIGARVAARARAGEALVSNTAKDLVAGSGLEFTDRGAHTLKGVPGEWRLYTVNRAS